MRCSRTADNVWLHICSIVQPQWLELLQCHIWVGSPSKKPLMPRKCIGCDGKACIFGVGGKAKKPSAGHETCIWCRPLALEEECFMKTKRGALVKQFKAMSAEQQAVAKERLDDEYVPYFAAAEESTTRCVGTEDGEACCFAQTARSGPVTLHGKGLRCFFCDGKSLGEKCKSDVGLAELVGMLRRMGPVARQKAIEERIPEESRKHFRTAFARSMDIGITRAKKRPAAALGAAHSADVWRCALSKRQRVDAAATGEQQKKYREEVLADRARARWRFGVEKRHPAGAAVDNDTGLEPPTHSQLAIDFDHWCRSNSWAMCSTCSSMVPRELTEKALSYVFPPTIHQRSCPDAGPRWSAMLLSQQRCLRRYKAFLKKRLWR